MPTASLGGKTLSTQLKPPHTPQLTATWNSVFMIPTHISSPSLCTSTSLNDTQTTWHTLQLYGACALEPLTCLPPLWFVTGAVCPPHCPAALCPQQSTGHSLVQGQQDVVNVLLLQTGLSRTPWYLPPATPVLVFLGCTSRSAIAGGRHCLL